MTAGDNDVVHTWVIWLIAAAVLGVTEIATMTMAFGLVGAAALIAAVAGYFGGNAGVQFGAFVLAAATGLAVIRPFALRRVRQPPLLRTGAAALLGRQAVALSQVTADDGKVRIGGEVWSARSYDETVVIPAGTSVEVVHIEGATAFVYPSE